MDGNLRAFGGMSLGMCISQLPKIKIKWVVIVSLCITACGLITLMVLPKVFAYFPIINALLGVLIYFAFQTDVKPNWLKQIFIYLGSLSFGMYAFQCVIQVIVFYAAIPASCMFLLIMALSIVSSKYRLPTKN
jgi:peptidoglycan/LPS O-acetylase OafA/YrhL